MEVAVRGFRNTLAWLLTAAFALLPAAGLAQDGDGSSASASDSAAALSAPGPETMEQGATLFADTCAACHQPEGQGVEGIYPALAGSGFVTGEVAPVVRTLLDGRGGMPSFRRELDDEQIAAVLTYVRNSWGQRAPSIAVERVVMVRSDGEAAPRDPNARPGAAD